MSSLASVPAKPSGEAPIEGLHLTRLPTCIARLVHGYWRIQSCSEDADRSDQIIIADMVLRHLGHVVEHEMSVRHVRQLLGLGRQH